MDFVKHKMMEFNKRDETLLTTFSKSEEFFGGFEKVFW